MKLIEVVRDLGSMDGESAIYTAEPWGQNSEAVVERQPETGLPPEAERLGLKYFIEVFIARDFLEDWSATFDVKPTLEQRCARLIRYAATDA